LHRGIVARALELFPDDRELLVPLLTEAPENKRSSSKGELKGKKEKASKLLRERSIFANTSQDFVNSILECGISRVFMPGDRIIEQGCEGTSMFILYHGTATVVTEQYSDSHDHCVRTLTQIGTLSQGSVFGELVMLGVHQKRTASIIASSVACTWEIVQKNCLSMLEDHPLERADFLRLVEEHLEKLAAPQIIYHPLFASFHQQFRTLIGVNCNKLLSFPGEAIVREGSSGDRLFVMNLGTASIELESQHVVQVRSGGYFGFGVMCGTQQHHPFSVIGQTMCQVLFITTSVYRDALQKYPEMLGKAKELEAEEKTKQHRQKANFGNMVKRRLGIKSVIEALRGTVLPLGLPGEASDPDMIEAYFLAWHTTARMIVRVRREEAALLQGNQRQIAHYLEQRQDRIDKQRPQMEIRYLIKHNLSERGPLKLPASKRTSHSLSPRRIKLALFHEAALASPYLSPTPLHRTGALSAREPSTRLPPIDTPRAMPKASPMMRRNRMQYT